MGNRIIHVNEILPVQTSYSFHGELLDSKLMTSAHVFIPKQKLSTYTHLTTEYEGLSCNGFG